MRTFTDSSGQAWRVELTYGVLVEIRAELGIDLLKPDIEIGTVEAPMVKLAADVETFVAALYVTCRRQIEARQMSESDFAASLFGAAIGEARDAFFEEWVDFFRQAGMGPAATILETLLETVRLGSETLVRTMEEKTRNLPEILTMSSGVSPALTGSIPGDSRSGSST